MEKMDKAKNHLRSNIHFYAIIAILGGLWCWEYFKGQEAHRAVKKHYEEQIKEKEDIITDILLQQDSLSEAIKKKEHTNDSLRALRSESQSRVVYIYKEDEKAIDHIRTVGRDSTRVLFTGFIE